MRNRIDGSLALAGYDDIFGKAVNNINGECVVYLPISELHPPEFHPFLVLDDAAMQRLIRSVKKYGVREPGLARPRTEGGYELLAGNRRKRACELAGLATMPVIVRELDDDIAAIAMVNSNLEQRDRLLFSEKAWAYRVKLEALNHSGIKGDMLSVDVLVEQTGESKNQIFRLVRLTELVPDLLNKVDAKQLAFNPAVELSYLTRTEQAYVIEAMRKYEVKPSLSQSVRLRKLQQSGELTAEMIDTIFSEEKKEPKQNKEISRFKQFFPADYTPRQIETVITDLLRVWQSEQAKTQCLRRYTKGHGAYRMMVSVMPFVVFYENNLIQNEYFMLK